MKISRSVCLLLLFTCFLMSCAPSRLVKPLKSGEQMLGANLGGPLINFAGAPIPLPYTSAYYAKGLNDKNSFYASLHMTALAFGVFQTDIGLCRELFYLPQSKWGLSVSPSLTFAIDRWDWKAKAWPQVDLNLHKEWGSKSLCYAGLGNWFELSQIRAHGETQPKHWFIHPQIGFQYSPGKWTYGLETKWLGSGIPNQPNVVDYIGIKHKGALGIYFQFNRRF